MFFCIWFHRWCVVGDIRQTGVAANTVIVLNAPFGWESVVIPAHGIENLVTAQPLIAGDAVRVGVAEYVTNM